MVKMLIDVDTGVDDSIALLYALNHPEDEIVGITTGCGNVDTVQAAENTVRIIELYNTKKEIQRAVAKDRRVKLLSSDKNIGKWNSIISGVSQASGKYIAFVDADLELNPAQLEGYLKKMIDENKDVVIGCKFHKDSNLEYPLKRKIISMGYYIMLLVLFHLNVKDTQTGLKVFKMEALKPVAHLIRTSGFAYDIHHLSLPANHYE